MHKLVFLLLAFSSAIIADRPEWYPENAAEIEAECLQKHPINAENMEELRKKKMVDTPQMRALAYCGAVGKNVYRPGVGFEPERFAAALKYAVKLDCKIDYIRECAEKHKNIEPEESMFFSTVKCIFDKDEGQDQDQCTKIED